MQQVTPDAPPRIGLVAQHRKHILLITADGRPGGGATNILQLCRALRKDGGWRITLCSQIKSDLVQQAEHICDDVHQIDFFSFRLDPRVTSELRKLIRNIRPDLIHTHGSRAALPTVYAAGRSSPPLVHTVHGFHFFEKSKLSQICAIKAERRIARRVDTMIFVCDDDKRIAKQEEIVGDTQSTVTIHHGVEIEDLPQKTSTLTPTVVQLARLVPQKHPEMLIEIAELLRDTGILFRFVGGGELEPKLKAEVVRRSLEGIVSFSGEVSRDEALRLASTADLAILPSRWEGFPIALLELLGMGIPVIAANVNGVPEILEDGFNGFLVEERKTRMYAERIRWLMLNSSMRSRFASNARTSVATSFSEIRMTTQYLDLYRETVAIRAQMNS